MAVPHHDHLGILRRTLRVPGHRPVWAFRFVAAVLCAALPVRNGGSRILPWHNRLSLALVPLRRSDTSESLLYGDSAALVGSGAAAVALDYGERHLAGHGRLALVVRAGRHSLGDRGRRYLVLS